MTFRVSYFFVFCFLFISINGLARQIDKELQPLSSLDRIRYINGHIEQYNLLIQPKISLFLDSVKAFAEKNNDKLLLKEIAFYIRNKPNFREQDVDKNISFHKRLQEDYLAKNELLLAARCQVAIGQLQFGKGEYAQAFENLLAAGEVFNKIGYENVPLIGKYLHDLALDHFFFQDYREAIVYMKKSIRLPKYNDNLDVQRYNTLGMSYLRLNQLDSAKYYLEIAYKKANDYHDHLWVGLIAGNIGEIYYLKGDIHQSLNYFRENYTRNINGDFPDVQQSAIISLAKAYLKIGDVTQTYSYLQLVQKYFPKPKTLTFGNQQLLELAKLNYYKVSYAYYKKTENYKTANLYADSLYEAEKIRDQKYDALKVKMASGQMLIQKNKLEIVKTQKANAILKLRLGAIIFVISLLAFVGYTLFYFTRKRKKRLKELYILNQKAAALELKKAQDEIDLFIYKINEQNSLTERFREELKKLKSIEADERKQLEHTLQTLRSTKILTDENWINFQQHFAKIYPSFLQVLKVNYPTITEAELRYLLLSKLQLSHKEMAQALGISTDAVRVTWNRVRKKLGGSLQDTPQSLIEKLY